jgi:hypothetical protein
MGIGLDRLVMLMKRIDDIRLLRSSDPRVARQMLNLDPYEPVSDQPAISRDMSICVADPDMELLGDRVRDALGERGGWVENVEQLQVSDYASVPEAARRRLGMLPGQQNLLIRVCARSTAASRRRRRIGSTISSTRNCTRGPQGISVDQALSTRPTESAARSQSSGRLCSRLAWVRAASAIG